MKQFLFQISNDYLSGAVFLKYAFAEVNYSVDNGIVKVWDVKIPYYLLAYLIPHAHFMTDIQAAAENNAMSEGLIPAEYKVTVHELITNKAV